MEPPQLTTPDPSLVQSSYEYNAVVQGPLRKLHKRKSSREQHGRVTEQSQAECRSAAVGEETPAAPATELTHSELINMVQMMQRTLIGQQNAHHHQLQKMHAKLANIERMQQSPLAGLLAGSFTLSDWRATEEGMTSENGSERGVQPPPALEPLKLAPTRPKGDEGDDTFGTDCFEQCYSVHMVIYGAAFAMAVSLKYSSRACDGHAQTFFTAMVVAFLLCFFARWAQHKLQQDRMVKLALAQVSGATENDAGALRAKREVVKNVYKLQLPSRAAGKARLTAVPCISLLLVSAFSLHSGLASDASDWCRIGGSATDMWDTLVPTWYAHVGTLEMLTGLLLTTHNLGTRNMLIVGIGSHIGFAVANMVMILPTADKASGRTPFFIVLCHLVQHLSFVLGCFLGHKLISGQRRFYDQAWRLRAQLLEKRCHQLQAEKERAVYDRQLMQHHVGQRLNQLQTARDGTGSLISSSSKASSSSTESRVGRAQTNAGERMENLGRPDSNALDRLGLGIE